eukprot:gb/GECH01006476.1/.p1 GENE.gb/GECH01006476.1/~~gb/GECH01006476.1/.p1  ORF type:complete len:147 (+),score=17.63 gb/GECH01006476.1/:1-441(+)
MNEEREMTFYNKTYNDTSSYKTDVNIKFNQDYDNLSMEQTQDEEHEDEEQSHLEEEDMLQRYYENEEYAQKWWWQKKFTKFAKILFTVVVTSSVLAPILFGVGMLLIVLKHEGPGIIIVVISLFFFKIGVLSCWLGIKVQRDQSSK